MVKLYSTLSVILCCFAIGCEITSYSDYDDASISVEGNFEERDATYPSRGDRLDPRTFQGEDTPTFDDNRPIFTFAEETIAVPDGTFDYEHADCQHRVPFESSTRFTPDMTGAAESWPLKTLVAIDRTGDGVESDGQSVSATDLTEMYWSEDDDAYYLGIVLASDWDDSNDVHIDLHITAVSHQEGGGDSESRELSLRISGQQIEDRSELPARGVPELAIADHSMILRFDRHTLHEDLASDKFILRVVSGIRGVQDWDRFAPFWFGFVDQASCLINLGGGKFKYLVFRRVEELEAEEGERVFRAATAAIQVVHRLLQDELPDWDTIPVTLVKYLNGFGEFYAYSGLKVKARQGILGSRMISYFATMTHEYAHAFNADRYHLPPPWGTEGHSTWAARQSIALHHGPAAYLRNLQTTLASVARNEREHGKAFMDGAPIPNRGYDNLYLNRKASMFFELLVEKVGYDALLPVLSANLRTGERYDGIVALLDALRTLPPFEGEREDLLWSGWATEGDYASSALHLQDWLTDTDGDGIPEALESKLGTDTANDDTDGDGLSDAFEYAHETDPLGTDDGTLKFLAADNHLADWQRHYPDIMRASDKAIHDHVRCVDASLDITMVGAVTDGTWLLVGIEMAEPANEKEGGHIIFVTFPDGVNHQLQTSYSSRTIYGGIGPIRPLPAMLSRPNRGRAEVYFHKDWLGVTEGIPPGTTVAVSSKIKDGDTVVQCEYTGTMGVVLLTE